MKLHHRSRRRASRALVACGTVAAFVLLAPGAAHAADPLGCTRTPNGSGGDNVVCTAGVPGGQTVSGTPFNDNITVTGGTVLGTINTTGGNDTVTITGTTGTVGGPGGNGAPGSPTHPAGFAGAAGAAGGVGGIAMGTSGTINLGNGLDRLTIRGGAGGSGG